MKRGLTKSGSAFALAGMAGVLASVMASVAAFADSAPQPNPFAKYADPEGVVLAVQPDFDVEGGAVRLSIYEEDQFLEEARAKFQGELNEDGFAIVPVGALPDGEYAFVAYLDENRDGKLNRSIIGSPKEPFGFSNGVRPKLSKPDFEDAKVDVVPGSVIVLTIED
ncbi:MAG: DUF2141 domain-containing protein [Pseudomonadota bacterium]